MNREKAKCTVCGVTVGTTHLEGCPVQNDCPRCHGRGWDGDGYTLCCTRCNPSASDLYVDMTCNRERNPETGVLKEESKFRKALKKIGLVT